MKRIGLLAFAMAAYAAGTPHAATVGGVTLEPRLQAGGQSLQLVSCGVRDTLWIDVYAAGLYVPHDRSAVAAAKDDVAKAVRMKIIQARYLPENIPEKWRGVLAEELKQEPMARVRAAYGRLSPGDTITFLYHPETGTTMQLNGERVVRMEGHKVIDAILQEWSENDPITGKLQRLSLEHPC